MDFQSPRRERIHRVLAVILVIALLWLRGNRCGNDSPIAPASASTHGTYTTNFPISENPNSVGALDRGQDCRSGLDRRPHDPGLAFGTESGTSGYEDSTVLLAGTWGPDQTVQATVHTLNQNDTVSE